jgi:small subunit ribosomal protein S2
MSIDFRKLIEAGVPFGHPTSSWNPKMAPYIWGRKNKVYLVNVLETARLLERAAQFLTSVVLENKTILWVGTKKAARSIITEIAKEVNCPFVSHRWIGGTLTNYSQIRKPLVKLLHFRDILSKADHAHYTKKELSRLQKESDRLANNFGGLLNLKWPIGAIVIVDVRKEQAALKEAAMLGIPVVALVDTNSDPELVSYVIPGNDDGRDSIKVIVNYLAEAVKKGRELAKEKGIQAAAAAVAVAAPTTEEFTPEAIVLEDETESSDLLKAAKVKRFKEPAFQPKVEGKKKPNK